MTLREAIRWGTEELRASPHLHADAQRDATLLLLHVLGISRARFHAGPEALLNADQLARYQGLIASRLTSEPVQYLVGEQEFFGLALRVSPAVLIPRPETEHLVEAVLRELEHAAAPSIADVGTGSGAIAIALARHLPRAYVTATDISPAALGIAATNAADHRLSDRIDFVEVDLLAVTPGQPEARFDAIVSNPPYIRAADRSALHPQVREFEPPGALFAGDDGLEIYRRLIPIARRALKPNGLLALEIGVNQQAALAEMLRDWDELRFLPDLQQIPRVALARRP